MGDPGAPVFSSISPVFNQRIPIDSSFTATFVEEGSGFIPDLDSNSVTVQNIIFEDSSSTPIDFTIGASTADKILIIPDDSLEPDEVYDLIFTSNIKGADVGLPAISQVSLKFLTENKKNDPVVDLTTDGNVNDIFRESRRVADLFNIEDLIDNGSKFNFAYTPRFYDPNTHTYSSQQSDQLVFDNQTHLINQYKNQFLNGFQDFITDIEGSTKISDSKKEEIKKSILTKAFDINTSAGLQDQIRYIIEIYANAFDKYFVDIEPDTKENFIYSISTSLPKESWLSSIKSLVHPIGWQENYFEITEPDIIIGHPVPDNNTGTFYLENHGLLGGQLVHFETSGLMPNGLIEKINYYIVDEPAPTTNYFQVSLTLGGQPEEFTNNGTGELEVEVLQYLQTENYQWRDEYLIDDDEGVVETGLRKDYYIKGQEHGYITPSLNADITSTSDVENPIYTTTNISNWSHPSTQLLISPSDASVIISTKTIRSSIDLSSYTELDELIGKELYIFSGDNLGFYIIVSHTNFDGSSTPNTITVDRNFLATEKLIQFEIHTPSTTEVEQSKLLAVLNSLQFKNRTAIPYIQLYELGGLISTSRLLYNEDGNLTLLFFPNSTVKSFTGTDTTFLYDSETNPVLWVESATFTDTDFIFGNTILHNDVTTIGEITHSSTPLNVVNLTAPESGTDIQTVTFDSADDITGIKVGHQIDIQGPADSGNVGVFFVIYYNYSANTVDIINPAGVAEGPDLSTIIFAEHIEPVSFFVTTLGEPSIFSFDQQWFNGLNTIFDRNMISESDLWSMQKWNYNYWEYTGTINYPDDADSDWSGFTADLTNPEYINTFIQEGLYVVYDYPNPDTIDIIWQEGDNIYEYIPDSSNGLIPSTINGTLVGKVEYIDNTVSPIQIIVKWNKTRTGDDDTTSSGAFDDIVTDIYSQSITDFTDENYYSNRAQIYDPFAGVASSDTDYGDLGSEFVNSYISYDRKYKLGYGVGDFDSYSWNVDSEVIDKTTGRDGSFIFFGDSTFSGGYIVTLDIQEIADTGDDSEAGDWSTAETISSSDWTGI